MIWNRFFGNPNQLSLYLLFVQYIKMGIKTRAPHIRNTFHVHSFCRSYYRIIMSPASSGGAAKPARTAQKNIRKSNKDKKKHSKRKESYSIYIYKVLKQVHPNTGISSKSMSVTGQISNCRSNFLLQIFSFTHMKINIDLYFSFDTELAANYDFSRNLIYFHRYILNRPTAAHILCANL